MPTQDTPHADLSPDTPRKTFKGDLERYFPVVGYVPGAADFFEALLDSEHPYHTLAHVLLRAYDQSASGKGKERHGGDNTPFTEQPMQTLNRALGSSKGMTYQVMKKAAESERLPPQQKVHELLGAINYAAGAVVFEETFRGEG